MVTDATTNFYATARNLYLGLVDASLQANERAARIARVWIDESLGAQQDTADLLKRAFDNAQSTVSMEGETPTPFTFMDRAGEIARTNYQVWTEAGLKAQERFTRVVQTAFEEMRNAQTEIAHRTEEGIGELSGRKAGR
jgi:hypothetical protein